MQRWDYLYVVAAKNKDESYRPRWVNGAEQRNWESGAPMHLQINGWGAEGWEMVSYAVEQYATVRDGHSPNNRQHWNHIIMIFKRSA